MTPPVTLHTDFAGKPQLWKGVIDRTEAELDPQTQMMGLVARVETASLPDQLPLSVGLFVQARIQGRELSDVAVLPRSALLPPDRVLVVQEGRVHARQVSVARLTETDVIIDEGLDEGQTVCLSQLEAFTEGMAVRTQTDAESGS